MKLFNLDGTSKDSFSIGTGKNRVEFKSFFGKIHYRNFNSGWKLITDPNNRIREWQPNSAFDEGEIFERTGALWYVKTTHTSGAVFESQSFNVAKVGEFSNITIYEISEASVFNLNSESAYNVVVEGEDLTFAHRIIVLPDSTHMEPGNKIEIRNQSNVTLDIKYNNGDDLFNLRASGMISFVLKRNSTPKGSWAMYNIGTPSDPLVFVDTKVNSYNANVYEIIPVDTRTGSFTINLPTIALDSDRVAILDIGKDVSTKNLILSGNGKKIENTNDLWRIDINGIYIEVVYNSSLESWFFVEAPVSGITGTSGNYSGVGTEEPFEFDFVGQTSVTIEHNFNYYPSCVVLRSSDLKEIETDIKHLNRNIIQITLSVPINIKVLLK